ncbi:MAG: hypothetical protein E6I50_00180, partial [Chloroflexi bacterium]
MEAPDRRRRQQGAARRRRPLRHQREAFAGGHRSRRRQLDPDQGQPDRHADRDPGGHRPGARRRVQLGDLAPIRRNRGHDHSRPCRGHRSGDDQDGRAGPFRARRQVQPIASDRGRARTDSRLRGPQPPEQVKPASRAVHAGRDLGARSPLAPDLSPASVHVYTDLDDYDAVARGEKPGHYYGRNSNANRDMLERAVAELEGAEAGVAAASGMAALHAAILVLAPRPVTIVATRELYGGSAALLRQDLEPAGYEVHFVDLTDLEAARRALQGAGLVIAETITNPLCRVPDLQAIGAMARERDV